MRACVLLLATGLSSLAAAAPRTRIAVTDVRNVQGVADGTATILSEIIVQAVARQRGVEAISSRDIATMVGFEKQKALLGCTEDSACLAEIGGALGVDYLLAGQVGQIGSRYHFSLLAVDPKKGRIASRQAEYCERTDDALAAAAELIVQKLLHDLLPDSVPAPAPAAAAAAPAATTKPGAPAPRRTLAVVVLGSGAALLAAGGIAAGVASSRFSALEEKRGTLSASAYASAYDADSPGIRQAALAADVLAGAGAAALVAGAVLWFAAPSSPVAVAPVPLADGVALAANCRF